MVHASPDVQRKCQIQEYTDCFLTGSDRLYSKTNEYPKS